LVTRDIAVFTLHKSASMFIHRQCESLCRLAGIDYHSPNLAASGLDARKLLTDKDLWSSRHGCFAPLRFFVPIPRVADFAVLLHLRDPRNVLVSMFYSYCYIHPGEVEAGTGYRRQAAAKGIDAFVLAKASDQSRDYPGDYGTGGHVEDLIGNLPRRYRDYIDRLLGKPNVTLLKYEEMVTDYRGWLTKFIAPFRLEDPATVVETLVARSGEFFPERRHDALSHIRHVQPGDHRAKLEPATIRQLNEIFADVLGALQYSREPG
jgi:Sulfotransferase domain